MRCGTDLRVLGDAPTGVGAAEAPTGAPSAPDANDASSVAPSAPDANDAPTVTSAAPDATDAPTVDPSLATALPQSAAAAGSGQTTLPVGEPFGTRYRITRELGRGGMGEVYEAWDKDLGVPVALKVIRPEVMQGSAGAQIEQRFKKELLLSRQVTHRNVVRIHDIGDVGGIKYISMPYIPGSPLSTTLADEGTLAAPRVLRYARQIAAGLAAAHEAGVVHRDLKPANIMIDDDDEALIMDFGIARAADIPEEDGVVRSTRSLALSSRHFDTTAPGAIVGTAAYMAPEQAQGLEADQRADVYSFGLILYDCLTPGRRGTTVEERRAEMKRRLEQGPEPLEAKAPDVPTAFSQIVMRCLAPSPGMRYQSMTELQAALAELDEEGRLRPRLLKLGRWQTAAAATVVIALTSSIWWFTRPPPVLAQPDPISVLIADFENQTGEAIFDDAVEGALAVALEGASFIYAYPRLAARELVQTMGWGDELDVTAARLVAAREGINVIVSGAVTSDGNEYHISTTSLDALVTEAEPLAVVDVSADSADELPASLGELAAELRGALGDTTPESTRLAELETLTSGSLEAILAYSQAQELTRAASHAESIPFYRRAVDLDPEFGRAYAGWATSALFSGQESEELFNQALARMDRMTERERLRTLGVYHLGVTGDFQAAVDTYTSLVDQYPGDVVGYNNLAYSHFFMRDIRRALEVAEEGLGLFPSLGVARSNYVLYGMYGSDFERAATEAAGVIEDSPDSGGEFFKNYLPVAIEAVSRRDDVAVDDAYAAMGTDQTRGAAHASVGLADYAMYQGRWSAAASTLERALSDPAQAEVVGPALAMRVALAETLLAQGLDDQARATIDAALESSRTYEVLVPAGRMLIRLGDTEAAAAIADELGERLPAQERAYGLVIEAGLASAAGDATAASDLLRDALELADLWLARYDLARALLERGPAGAASALGELQACLDRRGEAAAIFLDDIPSYRYMAAVPYWLARAQAGSFNTAGARENFQAYIALRENADVPDPLVADARERLAGL